MSKRQPSRSILLAKAKPPRQEKRKGRRGVMNARGPRRRQSWQSRSLSFLSPKVWRVKGGAGVLVRCSARCTGDRVGPKGEPLVAQPSRKNSTGALDTNP